MKRSDHKEICMRHQRGGAMLVMLVILVMGITTAFVTSLSGTAIQNHRNHSAAESLAQAKEALIGYAVTYGDTNTGAHGYLPCPDKDGNNGEGSSSPLSCGSAGAHQLGRLPWRTLDLPALFDGSSECLWYAVSGNYKNNPKVSGGTMNWDTAAQLHVYGSDGIEIAPGEIVALVIAPSAPLSGNSDRAGSAAPTCGGNYDASAYLENDTLHSINNTDVATGKFILPHEHRDANGNVTLSVNDKFIYITRQDIWNGIQKRIARQAKMCLDDYAADAANTNHKYPWAVQLSDATASPSRSGTQNVRFGRFPDVPNISTSGGGGSCPTSSSPLSHLTSAQISTLNNYIQQVQDALNAYTGPGATGVVLNDAGDNLKDLAQNSPYNLPWTDPIRAAGNYVENYCSGTPKTCTNISTMQTKLNAAFSEITDCTGSSGGTDATMLSSWSVIPSCQQLVSSASWSAWRDWVFLQIADGYQPGGSGSCTTGTTCLSITGTGHTNAGSGSYHAVVVAASKTLSGQNRSAVDTVSNFLEGANVTGKTSTPTTTSFETYRISEPSYNTVNDVVLCIDGRNNCP
jgi:type II secretory pathway pseudopilin PulG